MKKIWLLTALLVGSLLLIGCNNSKNNEVNVIEISQINETTKAEQNNDSWITTLTSNNEYFLNIDYQIKSWNVYINEKYEIEPTNNPIYLNNFNPTLLNKSNREYVWVISMEWNVLLTWYLENKMVPEDFFYETEEEMNNAPKVENWYIKYYPYWDNNPKTLNLWFMRENIIPWWNKEEAEAIIALWSRFFPTRIDSISHFKWVVLSWEMYGNNLHHFVNDDQIHTFYLEITWPNFEWEWNYSDSVIKNWEILE